MGTNETPQCLHFLASFLTNSLQSGHLTCVSGFGWSLISFKFSITKTKITPISGEKSIEITNQMNPDLPLLDARIPTAIAKKNQKNAISIFDTPLENIAYMIV
jgi:hypothetical protein